MPHEGTETHQFQMLIRAFQCIICPMRGRKLHVLLVVSYLVQMHPMPREGTETCGDGGILIITLMHPMPREGTETKG